MESKPIALETFPLLASWLNARGNIDRSACVEVRVSWVRQAAGCVVMMRKPDWNKGKRIGTRPLPTEKRMSNGMGLRATGVYSVCAAEVERWMREMPPRRLAGDWRTARAAAMRPKYFKLQAEGTRNPRSPSMTWKGFRCRVSKLHPVPKALDAGLSGNPNRGASRSKGLGVQWNWSQPVRIEQWQYAKRATPSYFLICPGGTPSMRDDAIRRHGFDPAAHGQHFDERLPGLSTVDRGFKRKGCPQRVRMLFMPLCTKTEARDAQLAQLWIQSQSPAMRNQHVNFIEQLQRRYGLLFSPRMLLCARCLGLHYGNNPETARRGYHRRGGRDHVLALRQRKRAERARERRQAGDRDGLVA